jgi:hypothetical protein
VSPFDLFNPATLPNPTQLTGPEGAGVLMQAAQQFPGGPTALVFALFWSPVGPGIPAGVLLARHVPLHPAVTFLLYAASDVLAAVVCTPLFTGLRRAARHVPALRWLGEKMLRFAMLGTRMSPARALEPGAPTAPALFRVATVGFGVDVYTAGMLANGLRVPRIVGWASAIAGDLVWFAVLLGTSIAAAAVADDDRVIGAVVLVAMLVIPSIARRIFPALRGDDPATAAPTTPTVASAATVTPPPRSAAPRPRSRRAAAPSRPSPYTRR